MRVAGAAQDSGGDLPVCPEGESKPMEVSGAPAPDSWAPEDRVAVETAWRSAVNRIAAMESGERFGRQGNSMRVERWRKRQ
jgi:hypothetical protein